MSNDLDLDLETSSVMAEYEATGPSQPPPPGPAEGGTSSLPPLSTPHSSTSTSTSNYASASASTATIVSNTAMGVAGPILSHIATIASHAEDTVTSITDDMNMSILTYLARCAIGNSLQSQLDLYHLNNLLQRVIKFATDENISGYVDGVTSDRLERACNSSSHLYHSIEAVSTKVRLFARCNKRRVNHIKGHVIRVIRELEESVKQFVWTMEAHLGVQLLGWAVLLELFRFARGAWEEVVA